MLILQLLDPQMVDAFCGAWEQGVCMESAGFSTGPLTSCDHGPFGTWEVEDYEIFHRENVYSPILIDLLCLIL